MAEGYAEGHGNRRGRGGRRFLTFLLALLIVLAVGLFAVDRFGKSYAERKIADRVAQEVSDQKATSGTPDVTIEGVPFLTQVVRGRYQEIRIQLPDFAGPAGNGKTVQIPLLDIRAKDVRAPLSTLRTGQGDIVAGSVTGTGTVGYAKLSELIDQPGLKLTERDGKLVGSGPVDVPMLGRTVDVSGTANLTTDGDVVRVRFSDVTAAGLPNIPAVRLLIDSYVQKLAIDLRVPELPMDLALRGVEARPDGLHVTAAAENVPLQAGGV